MAKFTADWRNPALLVSVILAILFAALWFTGPRKSASTAIMVGDRAFTENDVVQELKARAGKQVVTSMVSRALIDYYAQQQSVSVSEAEVDQLVRLQKNQVELSGQSFDDALKSMGLTKKLLREDLRTDALKVKLIVTPEEMMQAATAIVKANRPPFALPQRYRIRMMTFANEEVAKEAIVKLAQPDGLVAATTLAMDASEAKRVRMYAPELMEKDDPTIMSAIKGLKDGQCSNPIPLPGNSKDLTFYQVIQVVEVLPAEKPTLENSAIIAGYSLMQSKAEAFAPRVRDLELKALNRIDLQFYSTDYNEVRELFNEMKMKAPMVPGLSGSSSPAPAPPASTK